MAALLLLGPAVAGAQFRVVGYVPSWRGEVRPDQLRQLTHVNYAFVQPTPTGGLEPVRNPQKLQQLVAAAHSLGVRVLISVGGWHDGDHSAFDAIGSSEAYTEALANNLVRFAADYQLDGVDMDWEHPDAKTAAGYARLMQRLAVLLHPQGKLLTAAVAGGTWAGAGIQPSVFEAVDFLNIMAYDDPAPAHATYAAAEQTLAYWKSLGLPTSKAVLGLPFYGQPGGVAYSALLGQGASPKADLYNGVGYNGRPTIERKVSLAIDQASGVMIWEITQDAVGSNSLLKAISQVLAKRTRAPVAPR
jgi:GH18 family chitinase